MLCAELEQLEAELDEILTAFEDPNLTEQQKEALEDSYVQLVRRMKAHQTGGHEGGPCFEE